MQTLDKKFIEGLQKLIQQNNQKKLTEILNQYHSADIAEIIEELEFEQRLYIIKIIDTEKDTGIFTQLSVDTRKKILQNLSSEEIAQKINILQTDDAVDLIGELSEKQKNEVISQIKDASHTKDIVDLLRYDQNTAGGLMGKEYIKVNENWTNLHCVKEMRMQAEHIKKVHTIYVVDEFEVLKGRLSLKSLLTTATKTSVKEVYNPKITSVSINDTKDEVAQIMQKYDMFVIPVIDEMGRLVGQITIDDVVDVIKEEAERDYQMAAGISDDVEASDNIWNLTKARLPWLTLGLLGGLGAAHIMGSFERILESHKILFFFTPLIAAMAGNVGVQSSAIIVQAIANNNLKGSLWKRLIKEIGLSLINGITLSLLIVLYGTFHNFENNITIAIAISLIVVIIIAALIGTFIPIILYRKGIDPALATGPFITTSNDIFGILIYFIISQALLNF